MVDKLTKRQEIGYRSADGIVASISLYYNHQTQNKVLSYVIERLKKSVFSPTKATTKYRKARYKGKEA